MKIFRWLVRAWHWYIRAVNTEIEYESVDDLHSF